MQLQLKVIVTSTAFLVKRNDGQNKITSFVKPTRYLRGIWCGVCVKMIINQFFHATY